MATLHPQPLAPTEAITAAVTKLNSFARALVLFTRALLLYTLKASAACKAKVQLLTSKTLPVSCHLPPKKLEPEAKALNH